MKDGKVDVTSRGYKLNNYTCVSAKWGHKLYDRPIATEFVGASAPRPIATPPSPAAKAPEPILTTPIRAASASFVTIVPTFRIPEPAFV